MTQHIAIDIDGVVAHFAPAFITLANAQFGLYIPQFTEGEEPREWDWHRSVGLSDAQNSALWQHILATPDFWDTLEPYPDSDRAVRAVGALQDAGAEVTFITARPRTARQVTIEWLASVGFTFPQVLMVPAEQKLAVVQALRCDTLIEDAPLTLVAMQDLARTRYDFNAIGVRRAYNASAEPATPAVVWVNSLSEALQPLVEALWGRAA